MHIKSDFSKLRSLLKPNDELILIASDYCLDKISKSNRECFNSIHRIVRDFHEISHSETEQIVGMYANKHGTENIMLLTNEDSAQLVCAKLRDKFQIKGHSAEYIRPFVNKVVSKEQLGTTVRMYKFVKFSKEKYQHNKSEYLQTIIAKLGGFPLFAKPIDLVSSIGTHYIDDMYKLTQFAELALSSDYEFEIDEFIDGELLHCDSVLIDGQRKFFMVGKCSFPLARFFEGKPVGSIPIIDEKLFEQLKAFNDKVLKKLHGTNGVYHLEVFLQRKTKEIIFLEIAARTGGASITNVYEKIFGINLEEINYKIQMNLLKDLNIKKNSIYAGFLNFPSIKGTVKAINKPKINIEHEYIEYINAGDNMRQAKNLLDIACVVIFWDTNYNNITKCFETLKHWQMLELSNN